MPNAPNESRSKEIARGVPISWALGRGPFLRFLVSLFGDFLSQLGRGWVGIKALFGRGRRNRRSRHAQRCVHRERGAPDSRGCTSEKSL